ncbi:DUF1116 domain-containing protein [Sporosarcina aquimarina]|uniref:DUF1116 domain-containing protein n=1 Tax=Sporosarcina aquimarina TaxID=114975 RepID=UPI00203D596D|nr:DUF1116 domain-containing protein [Sporosarcina aquimarina]MCM3756202.1 DUF1116 domain-containing protein [Sporosarcina aquimarina]
MDETIEQRNQMVVDKIREGAPFLIDVVPAKEKIGEFNGRKLLLHAGPPIEFQDMTGPMQGACIGASLFEGWAETEADALALLRNGEVEFMPCHHVNAVGPMGGITSGNMPVFVVENRTEGNEAYCTMNEGIGNVLRFGAYSKEVIDRLEWMRDVLGPTLAKALRSIDGGMNLNVLIAKAITMGDEFHMRNMASTLVFLKEISPYLMAVPMDKDDRKDVIQFIANAEQFFLNIVMASGKSVLDGARKIEEGTIVTAMCRNGKEFGIRISGMGDQWFTALVNVPKGLYFTGYSQEDANGDIGDSAIMEAYGLGGMAMVASPGLARFVGAGGYKEAREISDEMSQIVTGHNANFPIPTWDFQGTCLGVDARKVVETGIEPLINTGIAHKEAGLPQIGAGQARAPLACFEKAIAAYAEKLNVHS